MSKAKKVAPARLPGYTIKRLPLAALRVFVIAAEEANFSRAAATLGLTTAAVSMQIRTLEEYLGRALFLRQGRRVALSGQGELLLPRVRRALEDMELALEAVRADRFATHLTVSTLSSFLQQWLLPRLQDFEVRHPEIELRIQTSRSLTDFLRSDVQVAIRLGKGAYPNLHAEKLFDEWWIPACAPSMLEKCGPVAVAADLKRYKLIHSTSEPWQAWTSGRSQDFWARNASTLDDSASVVHAALAGRGLALVRWSLAASEVIAGRLAIASRRMVHSEFGYYFVCPEANLAMKNVVKFRDWIVAQARTAPDPHDYTKALSRAP